MWRAVKAKGHVSNIFQLLTLCSCSLNYVYMLQEVQFYIYSIVDLRWIDAKDTR